jgi:hypothetical protein
LPPAIAAALPKPKVPQIVIMILSGVLIGPSVLGRSPTPAASAAALQRRSGASCFLLAGYELDAPALLHREGGSTGWPSATGASRRIERLAALVGG